MVFQVLKKLPMCSLFKKNFAYNNFTLVNELMRLRNFRMSQQQESEVEN